MNTVYVARDQRPLTALKLSDVQALLPPLSLNPNLSLTAVLFMIDERLCSACGSERQALQQFIHHNDYQAIYIDVAFK